MKNARRTPSALRRQIADLQDEVEALTARRDRLLRSVAQVERSSSSWASAQPLDAHGDSVDAPDDSVDAHGDRVYVLDDDDAEARAFDDFYRAYDDGHAKTRKFLLG